jgi:tripartite-type tricarboxylate transporter receptor subunit TctC
VKFGTATALCAAGLLGTLFSTQVSADSIADFYRGKRVSIYVGSDAGGGYDNYARLVSRHLGRFIPGKPDLIVQNMPGGGGIRVTNNLFNIAAEDGTAIGLVQRAILNMPLLEAGKSEFHYDPLKFRWLGSLNTETGLIIVSSAAPQKEMKDLFEQELLVGSSNPTTDYMPLFLNNVLGTKFKIISGYRSSNDVYLALDRGEVQGRVSNGWAGDQGMLKPWIDSGKVRLLAQLSTAKSAMFPDIPLITDFAKTERQRQAMDLILSAQLWGRPFLMPPGVPDDRFHAVQKAFLDMSKDADFLADAKKSGIDIDIVTGDEIDTLLHRVYATPPDIVEFVRKAVGAESNP